MLIFLGDLSTRGCYTFVCSLSYATDNTGRSLLAINVIDTLNCLKHICVLVPSRVLHSTVSMVLV